MSDLSFITAWGTRPPATRNIPQAHQGRYHYSQKSPTPTISHFSGNQSIFSSLTKETLFVSGNSFWGFSFNMQAANVISEKTHFCIDCSLCAGFNLKWVKNANYFYVLQSEKWSIEPGCASGWRNWHTDVSPRTQFNKGDFFDSDTRNCSTW